MITASAAGQSALPPIRFGRVCGDATGGAVGAIEEGWAPASNRSLRATRKGDAYADTRLLVRLADPASSTPE